MYNLKPFLLATILTVGALPALAEQLKTEQATSEKTTFDRKELTAAEVARREQLLEQMKNLQVHYASQLVQLENTRSLLNAAIQDCKVECTPAQIDAVLSDLNQYSLVAASTVTVMNGIRIFNSMLTSDNVQFDRGIRFFSRPWQTVAGRAMIASGAIYGFSSIVESYLNAKDAVKKADIQRLATELGQVKELVQQTNNNIKTISDSLTLTIKVAQQKQTTVINSVGYEKN